MPRKAFLRSLLLVFGFIAFLVVTFTISLKYFEKRAEKDVSNTKTEYFPVVVVTPNKSELVFMDELEKYKQSNPNYTFLIADENLVNQQLEKAQSERRGKGIPRVIVKSSSEGNQLVEVRIGGDGLYDAKYEATDKKFKPLTLATSGPGFVFLPGVVTSIFGFIGLFLLRLILWFIKRKQNVEMI